MVDGYATYRVVGIVEQPPVLVDQFDQIQGAVLPQAAAEAAMAHFKDTVEFSWVGMRSTKGDAGIPALQAQPDPPGQQDRPRHPLRPPPLRHHPRSGPAGDRPQAVALGVFGGLVALAMLALVGQGLAELLHRAAPQLEVLGALGHDAVRNGSRPVGLGGALAVLAGMVLAVGGAVALSPLAPVGPVRQFDPARGVQLRQHRARRRWPPVDGRAAGPRRPARLAGAALRRGDFGTPRSSALAQAAVSAGLPTTAALGIRYALQPPPGRQRGSVRANLIGSIVAVTAVITAVVFGASLNGLVTHPVRYGWNWNVLIQSQGGLRGLVRLQHGQAHGGPTGRQRLVDLRLHAVGD